MGGRTPGGVLRRWPLAPIYASRSIPGRHSEDWEAARKIKWLDVWTLRKMVRRIAERRRTLDELGARHEARRADEAGVA